MVGRSGLFLTGVKYELQHVAKDQRDADTGGWTWAGTDGIF